MQTFSSCNTWASPCGGLSCCRAWALRCADFNSCITWAIPGIQNRGSTVVALSYFLECVIFLDQGMKLCLLHGQMDSLPLSHQGKPPFEPYLQKILIDCLPYFKSRMIYFIYVTLADSIPIYMHIYIDFYYKKFLKSPVQWLQFLLSIVSYATQSLLSFSRMPIFYHNIFNSLIKSFRSSWGTEPEVWFSFVCFSLITYFFLSCLLF